MNANDYAHICRLGLDRFSSSPAVLLTYLETHEEDIKWAVAYLAGDSKIASSGLLQSMKSAQSEGPKEQFLEVATKYLEVVVDDILVFELPAVPKETQRRQSPVGVLGLVIAASVALFGNNWLDRLGILKHSTSTSTPPPVVQNSALAFLHALQIIVICVIIYQQHVRLKRSENEIKAKRMGHVAQQTFYQFRKRWLVMWWMWCALYVCLGLVAYQSWDKSLIALSVSDSLDMLSGYAIWRCFFVLDLPSVSLPGDLTQRDAPYRAAIMIARSVGIVCVVLAIADRVFHLNHVGLAMVGLYSGLALACLTGRLSSHYIGIPRWMILFLYLYSMIQLFYSFFDLLHPEWQVAIYLAAMALKVMLSFVGTDMLRYGGLDRYLQAAETGFLSGPADAKRLRQARSASFSR